jgi:L-fuconate dehydratase
LPAFGREELRRRSLALDGGRGNELCGAAIQALRGFFVGRELSGIQDDMASFWRSLVGDSQRRWVGPEKGGVHLAVSAVVNAVWDLRAKAAGIPTWKPLANMSADVLVSSIDFRHITDAVTPDEARALLRDRSPRVRKIPPNRTTQRILGNRRTAESCLRSALP